MSEIDLSSNPIEINDEENDEDNETISDNEEIKNKEKIIVLRFSFMINRNPKNS